MTYIRVGYTDFPLEHVQNRSLEELQTMYHYLPANVVRELHRQVGSKQKTEAVEKPKPKRKKK